jgi:hypothetical protein
MNALQATDSKGRINRKSCFHSSSRLIQLSEKRERSPKFEVR